MTNLKEYLLAENDKLRQENIRLHDKVDELSEDVGYYKGVVHAKGYLNDANHDRGDICCEEEWDSIELDDLEDVV